MGLDMYAYSTQQVIPPVDFEKPEDAQHIAQWRKHPDLHGWMEAHKKQNGLKPGFMLAPGSD